MSTATGPDREPGYYHVIQHGKGIIAYWPPPIIIAPDPATLPGYWQLATSEFHYFDSDFEHICERVERNTWIDVKDKDKLPTVFTEVLMWDGKRIMHGQYGPADMSFRDSWHISDEGIKITGFDYEVDDRLENDAVTHWMLPPLPPIQKP